MNRFNNYTVSLLIASALTLYCLSYKQFPNASPNCLNALLSPSVTDSFLASFNKKNTFSSAAPLVLAFSLIP